MATRPSSVGHSGVDIIKTEGSNTTYTKWWARFKSISGLQIGDRLFAVVGLFKSSPETTVLVPRGWSLLLDLNATRVYTKIADVNDTWPELVSLTHPELVSFIFYNPRAGGLRLFGEFVEVHCYRNGNIIDGAAGVRTVPNTGSAGSPHALPLTRARYPSSSLQFSGELAFRFAGANFGNSSIDDHTVRSKNAPSVSNTWSWVLGDAPISTTDGKSMRDSARGWPGNTAALDSYHDFAIVMIANTPPATPQLQQPPSGTRVDLQSSSKGAYEYWNSALQAWQATAYWIKTSSHSLTIPAGKFENGNTYAWSVGVKSAAGLQSNFSSDRNITGDTKPITSITSPGSSVTTTSTPTVTWAMSDPEAQPQQTYEVAILSQSALVAEGFDYQNPLRTAPAGSVMWGTGEVNGSDTAVNSIPLTNNRAYAVFVRTFNGQYSDWANQPFLLQLITPDPPTLSVVAE
jgi:hypothetical protein